MRRPEFIARQAAHPTGLLGQLIARIMARETETPNRRALQMLDLKQASRVLEIGFGHGRTLARAAELAPRGFVAGIDISTAMVEMAQNFNRDSIAKGLVEIRGASGDQIPYPDQSFDRIYAVHTLYFRGFQIKTGSRLVPDDRPRKKPQLGRPAPYPNKAICSRSRLSTTSSSSPTSAAIEKSALASIREAAPLRVVANKRVMPRETFEESADLWNFPFQI